MLYIKSFDIQNPFTVCNVLIIVMRKTDTTDGSKRTLIP